MIGSLILFSWLLIGLAIAVVIWWLASWSVFIVMGFATESREKKKK